MNLKNIPPSPIILGKGGMSVRCVYCGVEITKYPDSGICAHCGGKLPARPAGTYCPGCGAQASGNFCSVCGRKLTGAASPAQSVCQVYPRSARTGPVAGCPKCGSTDVISTPRGFSWGLAILGFFLIPGFGLLLGFCGSRKKRYQCRGCGKKWKPC